jgi:hypothetical protein
MQVEHEVEDVVRRRGDGRSRFANDHGDERKPRNRRLGMHTGTVLVMGDDSDRESFEQKRLALFRGTVSRQQGTGW